MLLWRIYPLLGKNLGKNNETTAVAMQRRGKRTIELLLETVFSTRSVQRDYKKDNWSDRSSASRRRRKGNPVPGGITGPLCSWKI
jgi:hypothetical protein